MNRKPLRMFDNRRTCNSTRKLIGIIVGIGVLCMVACTVEAMPPPDPPASPTPTAAPTDSPTPTPDLEATVLAAVVATIAANPTETPVPSPTITPEPLPTPTPTPAPTPTPTLTPTPTPEPTASPTPTPTATPTPAPTATPLPTPTPTPTPTATPTPTPTPTPMPTATPTPSLSDVVRRVRAAVVKIETPSGLGSGLIFEIQEQTAFVITNYHVIENNEQVNVIVNDSTPYRGTVLGTDDVRDLAVVRICCGSFRKLPFGDALALNPGDQVVTMGYALGIDGPATVTMGIVSAVRYFPALSSSMIQTDAAINPGNSGGPMFSLQGEVLGINTFKVSATSVEGVGFAVAETTVQEQIPILRFAQPYAVPTPTTTLPPTPTPHPRISNGIYTARQGFSLEIPAGWDIDDDPSRVGIRISHPDTPASIIAFATSISDLSIERIRSGNLSPSRLTGWSDYRITSTQLLSRKNFWGREYQISFKQGLETYEGFIHWFFRSEEHHNELYAITALAPRKTWNQSESADVISEFKGILISFTLPRN